MVSRWFMRNEWLTSFEIGPMQRWNNENQWSENYSKWWRQIIFHYGTHKSQHERRSKKIYFFFKKNNMKSSILPWEFPRINVQKENFHWPIFFSNEKTQLNAKLNEWNAVELETTPVPLKKKEKTNEERRILPFDSSDTLTTLTLTNKRKARAAIGASTGDTQKKKRGTSWKIDFKKITDGFSLSSMAYYRRCSPRLDFLLRSFIFFQ